MQMRREDTNEVDEKMQWMEDAKVRTQQRKTAEQQS
jgi:hypothetical protein